MNKTVKILGAAALLTWAFWNQPVYRRYKVDGKGKVSGLKILFISDLHNSDYGKDQSVLIRMIRDESPDVLLFGGDIADHRSSDAPVWVLLKGLEGLCPMYYITGNHEYWMPDTEKVLQSFRDYGLRVLMNETEQLHLKGHLLSILGIVDPDSDLRASYGDSVKSSLQMSYNEEEMGGYRILLAHRPEHIHLYMTYNFDLILSGHAHGGQLRIPGLLNGLYAPYQGLLPKYAGGKMTIGDTTFIISRGLAFRKKLPRIFNPPELVVLEF